MKTIGADDPEMAERLRKQMTEPIVPAPAKRERSTLGRVLCGLLLVLLAPAVVHAAWHLAVLSWGWGG